MNIDIAYAVDEAYLDHACVSIASIIQYDYPCIPRFWIFSNSAISSRQLNNFSEYVGRRAILKFVRLDAIRAWGQSSEPDAIHVSEAMYLRLYLPDILRDYTERFLYLDADILCTNSGLEYLFSFPMGTMPVAAVRDAFTKDMSDHGGVPGLSQYPEVEPDDPYFNSGVLVIDVKNWTKCQVVSKAEEYLSTTVGDRRFPDQDALNIACYRNWISLDKKWNHMKSWRLEETDERPGTLTDATLIHSAGRWKFWDQDFPNGDRSRLYERLQREINGVPQ